MPSNSDTSEAIESWEVSPPFARALEWEERPTSDTGILHHMAGRVCASQHVAEGIKGHVVHVTAFLELCSDHIDGFTTEYFYRLEEEGELVSECGSMVSHLTAPSKRPPEAVLPVSTAPTAPLASAHCRPLPRFLLLL